MSGANKALALLFAAFLLAGCGWLQYAIHFADDDGKRKIADLRASVVKQQRLNEKMEIRNDQMRANLDGLKNDPAHIEALARKWLFMLKPNEVYVVPLPQQ